MSNVRRTHKEVHHETKICDMRCQQSKCENVYRSDVLEYVADEFDKMVEQTNPDVLSEKPIATTI